MKKSIAVGIIAAVGLVVALAWKCNSGKPITLETMMDVASVSALAPQLEHPLQHLGCICDGNRRWAKEHGLKPWEGHKEGIEVAKKIVEFAIEKKIKYLSLYTFSSENFNRSAQEIDYLFNLMMQEAQKGVEEFRKHGIRIRFIGDRALFPPQLIPFLEKVEQETAHMDTLHVNFLFCYGGRQEIAAAAKIIAKKVKEGTLSEADITPEVIQAHLWMGDFPAPDLIIRTGKVSRLSNFLLYEAAYSELYMLDCYWPEVTKEHLERVYQSYQSSLRTFGA